MKSHDVRFWAIRRNKTAKGASYTVRWTVAGREKSHTLAGRARAERYKARLLQAADKGEAFDVESGLPDSLAREVNQITWLEHASDKARAAAFPLELVASPLARRPYDFRHAGISWRLNAGTPGPQVAEWAGHSVDVLYRVYAHCIDGEDERWYKRMEEFLG